MSPNPPAPRCDQSERVPLLAAGSLPVEELREMRAHIDSCSACREEFDALRRVTASFAHRYTAPGPVLVGSRGAKPDAPAS